LQDQLAAIEKLLSELE